MSRLFFTILIITSAFLAEAQIDSLRNILDTTSNLELKKDTYDAIFNYYYNSENDSALYAAEVFLEFAEETENSKFIVQALIDLGLYYDVYKGSIDKSLENYQRAYDLAITEALPELKDVCHFIGVVFHQNENYEKAKTYYQQAIELAVRYGDSYRYQASTVNLASAFSSLEEFDEAENLFFNLLSSTNQKHELLTTNLDPYLETFAKSNLANLYIRKEEYGLAIPLLRETIQSNLDYEDFRAAIQGLDYLSDVYIGMGQIDKLDSLINTIKSVLPKTNNLRIKSIAYSSIANSYFHQKKYEQAYEAKLLNQVYYDSFKRSQNEERLYELEAKYQNELKQNEINQLKISSQENELANQQKENQRNLLFFVSCLLLLLIIFFVIRFRQKSKGSQVLAEKNLQIEIALSEKETLLKEIHHRVKNNLQVVSSLLNLQANHLTDDAAAAIREGQLRVKSMALIHQKLYQEKDLMGIEVQGYLENLLSELLTSFDKTNEISYQVDTNHIKLDVDTMVPIGLIINELITNSLKYAFQKSTQGLLSVFVQTEESKLKVIVTDNGIGIPNNEVSSQTFGWKMIKSLCRQLKADISINTDNGTAVTLMITEYKLI